MRGRHCGIDEHAAEQNFNPRPLAGATHDGPLLRLVHFISIHAPLRGRPREHAARPAQTTDFNPRPLAGATLSCLKLSIRSRFQSTPPCGGDQLPYITIGSVTIFQSTPPCGGDHHDGQGGKAAQDFNPRPLAGATTMMDKVEKQRKISIHAPLRGRPP